MNTVKESARTARSTLAFVWALDAEEVRSRRRVVALVAGGRSTFEPCDAASSHEYGECSFFVESRRGEVVVQLLAELETSRVFATLRFDLSNGGAEALRRLRSQDLLTLHALSSDGALLGTAHAPLGVARRAWLDSALSRATRGASAG